MTHTTSQRLRVSVIEEVYKNEHLWYACVLTRRVKKAVFLRRVPPFRVLRREETGESTPTDLQVLAAGGELLHTRWLSRVSDQVYVGAFCGGDDERGRSLARAAEC